MTAKALLNFVFILLLMPLFMACFKGDVTPDATPNPVPDTTNTANAKTFLAIGDSYTIGQSVPSNERFPAQAAALLRQMNLSIKDLFILLLRPTLRA